MMESPVKHGKNGDNVTKPSNPRKRKTSLWLNKPKKRKVASSGQPRSCKKRRTSIPETPDNEIPSVTRKSLSAPNKRKKREKKPKGRKKLFSDGSTENLINEITKIIPDLVLKLRVAGIVHNFCTLLKVMANGRFPLHNIALTLLLDVARWYSLETTTRMTYPKESIRFWKVMYRLFHGKALRFMAGSKSTGNVITAEEKRGAFNPQKASINFAVPHQNIISNFQPVRTDIPRELEPGVIQQTLDLKSSEPENDSKCYVLSVDGKKLAPGLDNEHGDQDLFGHEEIETLQMTKDRLKDELEVVEMTKDEFGSLDTISKITRLKTMVLLISNRIKDLRQLYVKQTLALKKFSKEAGEDWRNSKFVYAISSVQLMIHQIKSLIKRLLEANDALIHIGATLNGTMNDFVTSKVTDTYSQGNWVSLKEPADIPEALKNDSQFIKQRTPEWFKLREKFPITGSQLYPGIGLDSLKNMQKHFDKVTGKSSDNDAVSEEVQKRLEHGSLSEINATATLTGKVIPMFYPDCKYIEEGAHVVLSSDNKPTVLVSPDGSLGTIDPMDPVSPARRYACEFKCPYGNDYKPTVHYEIPIRYIPQIIGEMATMGLKELVYLCWTEESSTVFSATFDESLWEQISSEIETLYMQPNPRRPTKVSPNAKDIEAKLYAYRQEHTTFLGELPSLKGTCFQISQTFSESPYIFPIPNPRVSDVNVDNLIDQAFVGARLTLKESYELCRKKATEVLVWLLSDTDRCWNPEIPHALPVGYALKGYSLATKTIRNMHDELLQACHQKNINVVCSCFDGQWLKLATRDKNDKPLTLIQLQRDVLENSKHLKREDIVRSLHSAPIVTNMEENVQMEQEQGTLVISSPLLAKLMSVAHTRRKKDDAELENDKELDAEVITTESLSCLPDPALESLIDDELPVSFTCQHIEPVSGVASVSNIEKDKVDVTKSANSEITENINIRVIQDKTGQITDSHADQNSALKKPIMSDNLATEILNQYQHHRKMRLASKWKDKTISDLTSCINDVSALQKLSHDELNVIVDSTSTHQREASVIIRKSWNTHKKANAVSKVLGSGQQLYKEPTVRNMKPLKEFAARVVVSNRRSIPKTLLNNIHATASYKHHYKEWLKNAPLDGDVSVSGLGSTEWFSFPEYNVKRNKLEPKCLDAHHLLVNLRVKVCKDGIGSLKKEAWHSVAEADRDIISKSLVVDLIDKQNNAFAQRTFCSNVELKMRELQYNEEADFCKLVREWYEAEDSPGISAEERTKRRMNFKLFLLKGVDFGQFPCYGMYVKGFPRGMFEGLLQRIDTTTQLYAVMKKGYNQRAISSLVNETFFGELGEIEPTKLGCPKAVSIPRLMSAVTEMVHYRCDPESRTFEINTTRKSVYPKTVLMDSESSPTAASASTSVNQIDEPESTSGCKLQKILLRNHPFDSAARRRRKQRNSKPKDVNKPSQVARGSRPVRDHHRYNESKILKTTLFGIEMDDIDVKSQMKKS